jgi:hypothetical protein
MIATLHTWSRTLGFHPHLHCLITGGGWSASGWKSVRNGYLLPFRVVRKLFAGKFVAAVRGLVERGELSLPKGYSRERVESLLRLVGRKKWNVHICERYAHGRGVLIYLGRYLRGGPIRDRQLVALTKDGRVVFEYTDYRDGRSKQLSLALERFVQLLTWHVPEPRRHVVRYYGLYARDQAESLEAAREELPVPPEKEEAERAARRDARTAFVTSCRTCGHELVHIGSWCRGRAPPYGLVPSQEAKM